MKISKHKELKVKINIINDIVGLYGNFDFKKGLHTHVINFGDGWGKINDEPLSGGLFKNSDGKRVLPYAICHGMWGELIEGVDFEFLSSEIVDIEEENIDLVCFKINKKI